MPTKRIESIVFRGYLNKDFRCSFIYNLDMDGKFKTVTQKDSGTYVLYPSFMLHISEGYERPSLYISFKRYFPFVTLFKKTVKLVQDNLYDLFPNVGRMEFEIDSRTLERFQTEQALSTAGMTMMPAVWVDSTNQCFPGLRITTEDRPYSVTIPLEDSIAFSEMLNGFDPNVYGTMTMFQLGRFE